MLPLVPVRVRDAYVTGEGVLRAAFAGVVDMADVRGTGEVAQGELLRFVAEAAWYPTALLPGPAVSWTALGDRSTRATLVDGPNAVSLCFDFDEHGLISTVSAEEHAVAPSETRQCRHRGSDASGTTRSMGRHARSFRGGGSWLMPEGARPYWRGRITKLRYEWVEAQEDTGHGMARSSMCTARSFGSSNADPPPEAVFDDAC